MNTAVDVFAAQFALDSNSADLDNALTNVANAVDEDAARRAAAQAKVDTATQNDATLRSELTAVQTRFESLSADCTMALGARSLTLRCEGVIEEARALMASTQEQLATDDRLVDLGRQIVAQFDNGKIETGNDLVDEHNDLLDTANASWDQLDPRFDNYDVRVGDCAS